MQTSAPAKRIRHMGGQLKLPYVQDPAPLVPPQHFRRWL